MTGHPANLSAAQLTSLLTTSANHLACPRVAACPSRGTHRLASPASRLRKHAGRLGSRRLSGNWPMLRARYFAPPALPHAAAHATRASSQTYAWHLTGQRAHHPRKTAVDTAEVLHDTRAFAMGILVGRRTYRNPNRACSDRLRILLEPQRPDRQSPKCGGIQAPPATRPFPAYVRPPPVDARHCYSRHGR